jgi:hypothetical protein
MLIIGSILLNEVQRQKPIQLAKFRVHLEKIGRQNEESKREAEMKLRQLQELKWLTSAASIDTRLRAPTALDEHRNRSEINFSKTTGANIRATIADTKTESKVINFDLTMRFLLRKATNLEI